MGYDPVFRSQASTPSAIQPAPHPAPSLIVTPQEPAPAPQPQAAYPAAPPGYVPAASQPFAPSLQSESSAPSSTEQSQFNYGAAIDPALEGNNNSGNMASVQHATNVTDGGLQAPANAIGMTALFLFAVLGRMTLMSFLSQTSSDQRPTFSERSSPSASPSRHSPPTWSTGRNPSRLPCYICSGH